MNTYSSAAIYGDCQDKYAGLPLRAKVVYPASPNNQVFPEKTQTGQVALSLTFTEEHISAVKLQYKISKNTGF